METQKYHHFKCNDFVLDDEFRAWLTGKKPENDHLWESWLLANPASRIEVEKARKIVYALKFKDRQVLPQDLDYQWKRLQRAVQNEGVDETHSQHERPFPFLKLFAAAAFLVVGSFFGFQFYFKQVKKDSVTSSVEQKTNNGQQLNLTLPDSTLVTLNAGSTLSYPEAFSDTLREVTLTGEAFFDVKRNPDAPFVIHTGDVITKVLGTRFNVRAYPENEDVQVAVVEGKVKVKAVTGTESDKNSVCITKSEMATFQKIEKALKVSSYDEKEQIGWKEGILYFEKSDFKATICKLERWYGVEISIAAGRKIDPSWRFSGKFQQKPLEYILDVMSYPDRFSFTKNENTTIIQ